MAGRITEEQFEEAAHDAGIALLKGNDDADTLVLAYLRMRPHYDDLQDEKIKIIEHSIDIIEVLL